MLNEHQKALKQIQRSFEAIPRNAIKFQCLEFDAKVFDQSLREVLYLKFPGNIWTDQREEKTRELYFEITGENEIDSRGRSIATDRTNEVFWQYLESPGLQRNT